ncbi:maltose-6'-phosphate glucosidase [Lapidilactobacillus achengensis]|uniref:Maltose-6'-phosphate glucosidase n=1 Tax=Lapidilactobacillus achengensis TaxID=2486000 RepID=A0ABW1UPX2_9LACO|nr:6-phospho-alpha-glucosidase [Lapidilactobacillus achengensis]
MSKEAVIVAIAGGGSTFTPGIVNALLSGLDRFPVVEIRLYDIDGSRVELMGGLIKRIIEISKALIKVMVTTDGKEAFTGVDFVFSQIRAGGLKMREVDEKIPLKYGAIGQETCGAGGFSYGFRTMKAFIPLVKMIYSYAPDAWILNYTNPESIVAEIIRRTFPKAKIINACDMTISLEETMAENLGYNRDDFVPEYYGLNHFGWYRKIYDKSLQRDILPEILEKISGKGLELHEFQADDESWQATYKMLGRMIADFPGYFPNSYFEYYLYSDQVLAKSDKNYTRANEVMDSRERDVYSLAREIQENPMTPIPKAEKSKHGQYIVDMAVSILNDSHDRFLLIVPNEGSIENVRSDAVVEVPAYVGATGVESITMGKIPDFHKGLIEAQCAAEKLLVDAFVEQDYYKALQAFTLNQAVPSATVAKKCLDEFIIANGDYWPELHK